MRRKRAGRGQPISLFPFLAVLVSTMGALVLLLLIIGRLAGEQVTAAAQSSWSSAVIAQRQTLERRRADLTDQLAKLRGQLQPLQHEELQGELDRADAAVRSGKRRAAAARQELERLALQRRLLEPELEGARRELEQVESARSRVLSDKETATHRIIIPVIHPGSQGTRRKPIFIECTADRLIIQPEQIALAPEGAVIGPEGDSGLSRVLRVLVQYMAESSQSDSAGADNVNTEPYPLLLVRPDGVTAYYAARAVLDQLELPFGYELIDQEWIVRYPRPDPKAKELALAALTQFRSGLREPQPSGEPTLHDLSSRAAVSPENQSSDVPPPTGHLYSGPTGEPIAIPRTIELECTADRIVVWSQQAVIPTTLEADEMLQRLEEVVTREVASWGRAGSTFRWEPRLLCYVHSAAVNTFYRIRFSLLGGRYSVDHEIIPDELSGDWWSGEGVMDR